MLCRGTINLYALVEEYRCLAMVGMASFGQNTVVQLTVRQKTECLKITLINNSKTISIVGREFTQGKLSYTAVLTLSLNQSCSTFYSSFKGEGGGVVSS